MLSAIIRRHVALDRGAAATVCCLTPAIDNIYNRFSTKAATKTPTKKSTPKSTQHSPPPPTPRPPPPPPPPASSKASPPTYSPSAARILETLSKELPYKDVVRYVHKNRTWTLQHVNYYSEALAVGIVENGFQPGDVVLSYLPSHFAEQMVLQFACSKAGLILYTLDPSLAITDLDKARQALSAALTLTKANVIMSQEAGDDVNYITLVQSIIPELRIFDTSSGAHFVTPRFPALRLCIHIGFDQDQKYGWFPLRQMIIPSGTLDEYITSLLSASNPLAGTFILDESGIPTGLGKTLTNEEVVASGTWPYMTSILKKEFQTVEGVGVIF